MDFPTTRWTLVARAAEGLQSDQREALNELLAQYWPILRAKLMVYRQLPRHDADDLVQDFLTSEVLGRDLLNMASKDRGRLRSFLSKALLNFASKQVRRRFAAKRQMDRATSLNDMSGFEPVDRSHAAMQFDTAWAREVLATALAETERQCEQNERHDLWRVFEARVVRPILDGLEPTPYEALVGELGYRDSAAAQNALVTSKRTFMRVMRQLLSGQTDDDSAIEEEIQNLIIVLAKY
ncbi:MAG: hypothetical protein R3E01_27710 [Pirellulaceae bacterium]|nr:sigma-70 family RNA polymerase sigma factor [Planctomycetales bacterium]